jgi:elongation of very long chain fatty acids protein 4
LVFVGVKYMGKPGRRNFKNELKPLVVVYNLLLVCLSLYMFVEIYREATQLDMGWVCNAIDYTPKSTGLLRLMWLYYISKVIEFNDTFLYILCGKINQVTVLHVWHHSFMWLVWWVGVKWAGGGDSWFSSWVNCGVHVIMYLYYAASAGGVRVPGVVKQMITQLQLLQFFIVMGHCVWALFLDCPYPHWMYQSLIAFLMSLVVLFLNFYINTYYSKRRARAGRLAAQKAQ